MSNYLAEIGNLPALQLLLPQGMRAINSIIIMVKYHRPNIMMWSN